MKGHVYLPLLVLAVTVTVSVTSIVANIPAHVGEELSEIDNSCDFSPECNMTIEDRSIKYFKNWLISTEPHLVFFWINFTNYDNVTFSDDIIQDVPWAWTYSSPDGVFPYLKWSVDYDILSFTLLNAKTLPTQPTLFITLSHPDKCHVVLGSRNTTNSINCALEHLTKNLTDNPQHRYSYYCYLTQRKNIIHMPQYRLGQYINYPVDFLRYNCCTLFHDGNTGKSIPMCLRNQGTKWFEVTIAPFVLGVILFAYCPIFILNFAFLFIHDVNSRGNSYNYHYLRDKKGQLTPGVSETEWVYLTKTSPLSIRSMFNTMGGLPDRFPICVSRIRRFLFILMSPVIIYAKIYLYNRSQPHLTQQLIRRALPMGFLAMLGPADVARKTFVPALGGPFIMFVMNQCLGILFVVFPKTFDDLLKDSDAKSNNRETCNSPLCRPSSYIEEFTAEKFTGTNNSKRVVVEMQACIYMLSSIKFWTDSFKLQKERFLKIKDMLRRCSRIFYFITVVPLAIVYGVVCLNELVLCILFYGLPTVWIIVHMSTCIMRKTMNSILKMVPERKQQNSLASNLLSSQLTRILCLSFVGVSFAFYTYGFCLIFTESFIFFAEVAIYCLVAVIMFPTVAFGYLFFGTVLLYYVFRLLRGFGDGYTDLLADIVESSCRQGEHLQHLTGMRGCGRVEPGESSTIVNAVYHRESAIVINDFARDNIPSETDDTEMVTLHGCVYRVRRKLFDYIVQKHRPVHIEFFRMFLHLVFILLFITGTFTITKKVASGLNSDISEVMHVMFMVTVGALPRVLEVTLSTTNKSILKDIELRELDFLINEFQMRNDITRLSVNSD